MVSDAAQAAMATGVEARYEFTDRHATAVTSCRRGVPGQGCVQG